MPLRLLPSNNQPAPSTVNNPPDISTALRNLARRQFKEAQKKKRDLKKKKDDEKKISAFRDYFDYREEIRRIPPHRVLAINRGERARVLRVRVEADMQAMIRVLEEMLVPPEHPHVDYLRGCARDALTRLILPEPGAGNSPRVDRSLRSPRRGSVRQKSSQPALAAAGEQPSFAGGRSGL